MTSTLNHPHHKKKLMTRLITALMTAQLAFIGLVGCNKSNNSETTSQVQILSDKVIVDKSLIHTNTPERYKPTYNLDGKLIPVNHINITLPDELSSSLISSEVFVKVGDDVEEGQIIAEYVLDIDDSKAKSLANEFTEVYINGERYEVESEVSQVTSAALSTIGLDNSNESVNVDAEDNANNKNATETKSQSAISVKESIDSDTTTKSDLNIETDVKSMPSMDSATSNAKNNPNQNDESLVTLVYKSTLKGEVTNIETNASPDYDNSKNSSNNAVDHDLKNPKSNTDADADAEHKNPNDTQRNSPNKSNFPPVITIADTHHLQLIGKLPLETKSQLSVGRHVNFTVYDLHSEFTGQISHIDTDNKSKNLIVRAPLVPGENNAAVLEPGMDASMRIEYGQMQLGVRVPKEAIHEANLAGLSDKHPRPTTPLKGYVWIIGQDKKLAYDEVEIVQYFADSGKYLVSGIDVDSLVCLADLPKDSVGKTISVK